jgi:hypothetical protein
MPDTLHPEIGDIAHRAAEGVWHLLGSRRSAAASRCVDRDSRQCLTPDREQRCGTKPRHA